MPDSIAIVVSIAACICYGTAVVAIVPAMAGRALAARGLSNAVVPDGSWAAFMGVALAIVMAAVAAIAPQGSLAEATGHTLAAALVLFGTTMAVACAAAACDCVARIVPNGLSAALAGLGAVFQFTMGGGGALVASVAVGAVLATLLGVVSLPFGRDALGGGDVKLMFALGLTLGWTAAPWALCAALFAAAAVMGVRALRGKARLSSTFALGPYLCCALVIGQAALLTV